jgi:hypothetical protein
LFKKHSSGMPASLCDTVYSQNNLCDSVFDYGYLLAMLEEDAPQQLVEEQKSDATDDDSEVEVPVEAIKKGAVEGAMYWSDHVNDGRAVFSDGKAWLYNGKRRVWEHKKTQPQRIFADQLYHGPDKIDVGRSTIAGSLLAACAD